MNAAQRLERRGSGGEVAQAVASESQPLGCGRVSRMFANMRAQGQDRFGHAPFAKIGIRLIEQIHKYA